MTRRPSTIPAGSWPRRMGVGLAAGYCGELYVARWARISYPRVKEGRREMWLKDDLDAAIASNVSATDLAEDL